MMETRAEFRVTFDPLLYEEDAPGRHPRGHTGRLDALAEAERIAAAYRSNGFKNVRVEKRMVTTSPWKALHEEKKA
jgi:hypothetical protein